jgi:hypothetical protein
MIVLEIIKVNYIVKGFSAPLVCRPIVRWIPKSTEEEVPWGKFPSIMGNEASFLGLLENPPPRISSLMLLEICLVFGTVN